MVANLNGKLIGDGQPTLLLFLKPARHTVDLKVLKN